MKNIYTAVTIFLLGIQSCFSGTTITTIITLEENDLIVKSTVSVAAGENEQFRTFRLAHGNESLNRIFVDIIMQYAPHSCLRDFTVLPENPLLHDPLVITYEAVIKGFVVKSSDILLLQLPLFSSSFTRDDLFESCAEQLTVHVENYRIIGTLDSMEMWTQDSISFTHVDDTLIINTTYDALKAITAPKRAFPCILFKKKDFTR